MIAGIKLRNSVYGREIMHPDAYPQDMAGFRLGLGEQIILSFDATSYWHVVTKFIAGTESIHHPPMAMVAS
jgi:hypothetical protein